MTKQEALDFIENSAAENFRYGDIGFLTSKQDALEDILSMEDEAWGDGEVYEEGEE